MSKPKPNITLNFYGSVGQQIANVENQTVYVGKDGNISIANVEHATTSPEPSLGQELATFEQCLSYAYAQRYPDNYQSLLSLIRKSKWCDKDHARVALAFYNSPVMSTQHKPNTFLDWYRIYCDTFHVQYHNEYTPSHLNENKVSQSILKYLTVPQP